MTGYPGDEHVFSVVGVVLARSPDCNLRSLVVSCVPAALLRRIVSDLSVLHLLGILWTVSVSTVYSFQVCRVLCAFRQLILKQQLTSCAAAVKRTAFSQRLRWQSILMAFLRAQLLIPLTDSFSHTPNVVQ